MYSAALGQRYDDIRGRSKDFKISTDDMKEAEELCDISADVDEDEAERSLKLKAFFGGYYKDEALNFQESLASTGRHNNTSTDSTVKCVFVMDGSPNPVSIELEYRNDLVGDAAMQAVACYLVHHKNPKNMIRRHQSVNLDNHFFNGTMRAAIKAATDHSDGDVQQMKQALSQDGRFVLIPSHRDNEIIKSGFRVQLREVVAHLQGKSFTKRPANPDKTEWWPLELVPNDSKKVDEMVAILENMSRETRIHRPTVYELPIY